MQSQHGFLEKGLPETSWLRSKKWGKKKTEHDKPQEEVELQDPIEPKIEDDDQVEIVEPEQPEIKVIDIQSGGEEEQGQGTPEEAGKNCITLINKNNS